MPGGLSVDNMEMSKAEYRDYVKKKEPKSRLFPNLLKSFFVGGLICCAGQGIFLFFSGFGINRQDSASWTSITLIFIGAALTGLGWYDNLTKFGCAGTLVPITGFANAVVSPALEFKSEGLVLGMSTKMFVIAGPVIVFGMIASVVYGIILAIIG